MIFSLVIPVHNEGSIIVQTINKIISVLSKLPIGVDWDVVVVDNGSEDDTRDKVLSMNSSRINLLSMEDKGKGLAICYAAKKSKADFFGFIDADLSADPESILLMLDMLMNNKVDIVIGSRFVDVSIVNRDFFRTLTSKIFNLLQRVILGLDFKDTQCGLKIMNKKGLDSLVLCGEKGWFFDLEFLYLAKINKLIVKECPVSWEEFRYYQERKSKLKFLDSFRAILAMFRIRNKFN